MTYWSCSSVINASDQNDYFTINQTLSRVLKNTEHRMVVYSHLCSLLQATNPYDVRTSLRIRSQPVFVMRQL